MDENFAMGYAMGQDNNSNNCNDGLFGGGSGAGVSIQPLAFLVIQNGNVKLMQMQSYHSSTERAVGMVPELVDKFAAMFSKEKKAPAEDQTV